MSPYLNPQPYPPLVKGDTITTYLCPSTSGGRPVAFDRNGKVILLDFTPSNESFTEGQYVKLLIVKDLGNYYKARILCIANEPTNTTSPRAEPVQPYETQAPLEPRTLFTNKVGHIYVRETRGKKQGITIYISYDEAQKLIKPLLNLHLRKVKVTATLE